MPCVLQGIRKPIHKKSCIPSLFCVSTPLLSCFEVKKTTKFDWFWVNLKTNCTTPASNRLFVFQPVFEMLSVGSGCNILFVIITFCCKTLQNLGVRTGIVTCSIHYVTCFTLSVGHNKRDNKNTRALIFLPAIPGFFRLFLEPRA